MGYNHHPESADRKAAFETGIHLLITKVHAIGARLVLLTPPPSIQSQSGLRRSRQMLPLTTQLYDPVCAEYDDVFE